MRVKAYMAAYYLAQAVYQSYMSLFYRARGMTRRASASFTRSRRPPPSPGNCSLARRQTARASRAAFCARCCFRPRRCCLLQAFARDAFALFALAALFGFAYTPVQPIGDALALERLAREGKPFGPARLMGALAFAASALVFGFLLDASGRESLVALAAAALMLVALFCSFLLGRPKDARVAKCARCACSGSGKLLRLLLFILPAQVTMGYFYAFFPTRFLELPGATGALLGWANLVSALAEIPFLLVGDRPLRPLGRGGRDGAGYAGAGRALAADGAWGKRLPAPGSTDTARPWLHCHFPEHGALHPPRSGAGHAGLGQALLNVFCYGVARVLGNALGGVAARAFGEAGGFLACALLCFLSLAAFFPVWKDAFCNSRRDMV